jgi:hypothetical protein
MPTLDITVDGGSILNCRSGIGRRDELDTNIDSNPNLSISLLTVCQSLVCLVRTNDKPLVLNIFCYLEAEERMDEMKEGVLQYRTPYSTVPESRFSWEFSEPENCEQTPRIAIILDPANFTVPKLGARGGTSDDLQAQNFPTFFSSLSP